MRNKLCGGESFSFFFLYFATEIKTGKARVVSVSDFFKETSKITCLSCNNYEENVLWDFIFFYKVLLDILTFNFQVLLNYPRKKKW